MSTTDTATDRTPADADQEPRPVEASARVIRAAIWLPGLAVALGAAVATAHGLYEVAVAARVPAGIAWLYPLITDGLALVAYAATTRLASGARRYAWAVVILAAGLSGLAQASYLAATPTDPAAAAAADAGFVAPALLRFGVGAWPAIAAAIVAHLLYLLATDARGAPTAAEQVPRPGAGVQPAPFSPAPVQPERPTVQPVTARPVQPPEPNCVQRPAEAAMSPGPALAPPSVGQPDRPSGGSPARDRARAAAARHAHRHGALPTVSELEAAAEVSRGTAAAVLKHLRAQPTPLHLITRSTEQPEPSEQTDDPSIEENTQP